MTATIVALAGIVATSALGSVHCVAMCGPLIGLQGGARSVRLAAIHSFGRLLTYVAIGALAGLTNNTLDLAGKLGNNQRLATLAAGATIVGWGIFALVRAVRPPRTPAQPPRARTGSTAFGSALVHIRTRSRARRTFARGRRAGRRPGGGRGAGASGAAGGGAPQG